MSCHMSTIASGLNPEAWEEVLDMDEQSESDHPLLVDQQQHCGSAIGGNKNQRSQINLAPRPEKRHGQE